MPTRPCLCVRTNCGGEPGVIHVRASGHGWEEDSYRTCPFCRGTAELTEERQAELKKLAEDHHATTN